MNNLPRVKTQSEMSGSQADDVSNSIPSNKMTPPCHTFVAVCLHQQKLATHATTSSQGNIADKVIGIWLRG